MHPPHPAAAPRLSPDPAGTRRSGDFIAPQDVSPLFQLMGLLGSLRNDPRTWRQELLAGLNRCLPATASAAFVLKNVQPDTPPVIVSVFDAGFLSDSQRQAFLHEFNTAPFQDPLARVMLQRYTSQQPGTLTCLRSEVIDDTLWNADTHVLTHRRLAGMGDALMSIQRGSERGSAYVLYLLRAAVSGPAEGSMPGADILAAARFGQRERLLVDALHRGLDWMYRSEESTHKLTRASALPPRLRQTLEHLLSGDTERQVAMKMSISVHTVHDYVKSLYAHFGVSSRTELMSRWMQNTGQFPPPDKGEA